ncbi:hypothetical protein COEREDRAFT_83080 [Coemansia reversa NRRL 1564]|uniref:Mitochondrial inner membrane protease ATP23 n=1 Tax=Coemansia reversa (strain ATCC 12441 / NRRL 1564) TaxID=763665 RepID=A0A2G5B4U0_COERN|nr:hypothetical protein COEREDRAFT_83080 [Coemansia reversa NRRL 1564]|eukprot:PIA14024.1 hypothetical protein COEREDRAFT_83080 [Coemansia reversa NRRL 1564]
MAASDDNKKEYQRQYLAMDAKERGLFDGWVHAAKGFTGLGLTAEERKEWELKQGFKKDLDDCKRCEKWRNKMLKTSPLVTFMTAQLKASGFNATAENMPCVKCSEKRSGGYSPTGEIQLCYNNIFFKGHQEATMVHEMIHAYDDANFKLDWYNLEHHACTEIRAASLSGDCKWTQEFMRGNMGFLKHHQVCVKRRAALSVRENPSCKSDKHAEAVVNKVFQSCFTDTRPFDEIY